MHHHGTSAHSPREDRRPRHDRHDRDDRVVGMGDHVPDFILRSFKLAERPVEEFEAPEAVTQDIEVADAE